MTDWQTTIIGIETQIPFHNRAVWRAFLEFTQQVQPNRIIGIGDHLDCPAPARWNRGTLEEYATNLQYEIDLFKAMLMELRTVYDGPLGFHRGNHEARIDAYAKTKAPAFADLAALQVANLCDYTAFEAEELPKIATLCPGWVTTHGDIGGGSRYSGGVAMGLARRLRRSVICGHTHKLGHLMETDGAGTLHGVETGHMMDVKKAGYVKHGCPNWQAGWVMVENKGPLVKVHLIQVSKTGVVTF